MLTTTPPSLTPDLGPPVWNNQLPPLAMLYKVLAVSALSLVAGNDVHKDPEYAKFAEFIQTHRNGLPYRDEIETIARFGVFKENLKVIHERNAKGQERHGVNKFADLTPEEFRAKHTGLRPASGNALKKLTFLDHGVPLNYTAASIDWNTKGALTPVRSDIHRRFAWPWSAFSRTRTPPFHSEESSPSPPTRCSPAIPYL